MAERHTGMTSKLAPRYFLALLGLLAGLCSHAQTTTALRATELRADKLGSSPVLSSLAAGTTLRVLGIEGGWAQVESAGKTGWVRASAVNLQAGSSAAASVSSGREASGNTALTLGVRSLPPRANRHALIIGIGRYADPATPSLPGTRIDRQSATQMAQAMQVPQSNIRYLQDEQATGDNIRKALADLTAQVQDGDRVFIHYSGHGTRYNDPAAGGCVEALLAYDGGQSGTITNREMADLLKTITGKTDKLFVMYDACHSGGLVNLASGARTRGLANANDEGLLRPKFSAISEECGRPVNVKTRNLLVESTAKGALPQDIIHLSASRDNEISFDDELKGGLATQFMRDCMLRDARDLDDSGAISIDEIKQCAQEKINKRMQNDANFKPHNLTLSGNAGFVPAWFGQALPAAAPAAPVAAAAPATTVAPAAPVAAAPTAAAPPPLTGAQALRQMFDQRDAKRRVQVTLGKNKLRIGQDALDFSVQSDRPGYVYVALAGSDNKSVYLLFPNDLDQNNKLEAGQQLLLPRPNWRVKAGGPAGIDNLLVLVSDGPRDLTPLAASKAGPFVSSLNDAEGRARLGALLSTSRMVSGQECASPAARKNNPLCSDAFGASMLSVEEVK
ncbi:caspase family protein [Variovorax terrae]|uniref:Caspase family protein n=1 Tax=Variovorax terrae TaxID=2923278 RepID=A0A9X2AQI2_9BURK|nr:caspase family protein [Variovorax terrae]MCJ0764602.1 caspase family protein [Variovorax terrae]